MKGQRGLERSLLAGLFGVLFGGILMVAAEYVGTDWAPTLLRNAGSFVIASVAMAALFEHWQLRGLLDDLAAQVKWVEEIKASGISGFTLDFHKVPWADLFEGCNRLDMMVAYARTWRNTNQGRLEALVAKPDSDLEVILPDPEYAPAVVEMASRFGTDEAGLRTSILEARAFFEGLGEKAEGKVRIYYLRKAMTFTFYRFNTRAVLTTYRHRLGRGPVLTFLADRDGPGELYNWIREEWYGMLGKRDTDPVAYEVYSNEASVGA